MKNNLMFGNMDKVKIALHQNTFSNFYSSKNKAIRFNTIELKPWPCHEFVVWHWPVSFHLTSSSSLDLWSLVSLLLKIFPEVTWLFQRWVRYSSSIFLKCASIFLITALIWTDFKVLLLNSLLYGEICVCLFFVGKNCLSLFFVGKDCLSLF